MKKSINQWAFPDGNDLEGGIRLVRTAGFEAVEPVLGTQGPICLRSSEEEVRAVAETIRLSGLEISSLATGIHWETPLTAENPETRAEGAQRLLRAIDTASWLETDALLVIPGAVDICFRPGSEVVPYERVYERLRGAILNALSAAEKAGVCLCLENVWNGFFLSPLEMRDFVDTFQSPYVGVYFDVGNVVRFGYPEQWIRILKQRIRRVHLKDYRRTVGGLAGFVDLLAGDVNWPEVMGALEEIGYDGYLTAEVSAYRYYPEAVFYNTSKSMDFLMGRA